jgi:phosphoglycolate phosphatase-like HAD superfamily hydrolase
MRKLILFDIDGTLITDGGAARDAYGRALIEVYGYRGDIGRYDFSGRTDPQITHMVLGDDGFSADEIEARLPQLWDTYLAGLERNAVAGRVRVLPGIAELLEALSRRDDVLLALLTGNVERGARIKLAPVELNRYFSFGAFGSDSPHREELPPIAVNRAEAETGHRLTGRDVVIIGDSIYDVRCGVPHDATTIAVASGRTSAATLRAENPTHFFDDVRDTEAVLQAMLDA